MGWNIRFLDYRSSLAQQEFFLRPSSSLCESVSKLFENIPQGAHVAVVLMTHNYEADLEILRGLKNHRLGYLGCLGPAIRYERLKSRHVSIPSRGCL